MPMKMRLNGAAQPTHLHRHFKTNDMNRISRRLTHFETADCEKTVEMTEIGKSRIRSLIKVEYFLSISKFLDLGRLIESEP